MSLAIWKDGDTVTVRDEDGDVILVTPDELTQAINDAVGVPTLIADGETFTVPANRQVGFRFPIVVESGGQLQINGVLYEI